MNKMAPETPKLTASKESETASPAGSSGSDDSLVDPPGYIAPDQQDMMLTDITSEILHSLKCTLSIGSGKPYLSEAEADSFPLSWPATGVIFGYNKRLMINLPCRRARPKQGYKVLNVFFLVDTGSPCSYLCQETMDALIDKPGCALPEQLKVVVQDDTTPMAFHMSPLGTKEAPGKFHDVNVLGMDFLCDAKLSMTVDAPILAFKLVRKDDLDSMYRDYPSEEF